MSDTTGNTQCASFMSHTSARLWDGSFETFRYYGELTMTDRTQWHESSIPMDGQQILIRTRRLPLGWDWQVRIGDEDLDNPAGLAETQERAISAALHEAAGRTI